MAGKRVVVTGASSGIGAAIARRLAAQGWLVVAAARRLDRLEALAAEAPGSVEPFELDITDDDGVAALAAHLTQTGGLDALVNNAGGAFGLDSVADAKLADWEHMLGLNVLGTLRITKALLPLLLDRWSAGGSADGLSADRSGAGAGGGGVRNFPGSHSAPDGRAPVGDVVFITSTAALAPYQGGAGYVAAKHGERMLATTLRWEQAGQPLRVIQVEPGAVETAEFSLNRFGGDRARADATYAGFTPLTADDVAEAVTWALNQPPHVNIDHITIRPRAQVNNWQIARNT